MGLLDRGSKWHELNGVESRHGRPDNGKPDVRIDVGVAVTGKMFRRRDGAGLLKSLDEERRQARHLRRILAE